MTDGDPAAKTLRTPETIISELAAFPGEFQRLVIRPHDRDALLRPAADGGWGVVEILPHLRDWEEISYDRIVAIVENDVPRLPSFDDSLWSIERDYRGQDPETTFAEFAAIRRKSVALLEQLHAEAWAREAEFAGSDDSDRWRSDDASPRRVTLRRLGDEMCDHDREHLHQALDAVAS